MGTKMKGIYRGFNKYISQIFVVKEEEHEMEIGYPTDVKHLAHIGWDGQSSNAPTWMNEFNTTSDFSTTSMSNLCDPTWSSQEFEQSMRHQRASSDQNFKDLSLSPSSFSTIDLQNVPTKKEKKKRTKSAAFSLKNSLSFSSTTRSSSSKSVLQSKTSFGNNSLVRDVEIAPGLATRTNHRHLLCT